MNLSSKQSQQPLDPSGQQPQSLAYDQHSSNHLMEQYFKLINTLMHGQPGGIVESESFTHDFRLPKCYDMPKFRELAPAGGSTGGADPKQLISPGRCQQFPDKVLFYIFYSMPHDKAQLNAALELKNRKWLYCNDSMRWLKANNQAPSPSN